MLDVVKQRVDGHVKHGNGERITLENAYLETDRSGLPVLTSDDSLLVVVETGCEWYQFVWGIVVKQCKLSQLVVNTSICISHVKSSHGWGSLVLTYIIQDG